MFRPLTCLPLVFLFAGVGPCDVPAPDAASDAECIRDSQCDDDEECEDRQCVPADDDGEGEGPGEGEGEGGEGEGEGDDAPAFCAEFLGVGDGCDCGCGGVSDADCGGGGCAEPGCSAPTCEFCYDAVGEVDCAGPPPGECEASAFLTPGETPMTILGTNYFTATEADDPCLGQARLVILGLDGTDDGFALDAARVALADGTIVEAVEFSLHADQWNASFCVPVGLDEVEAAAQTLNLGVPSVVDCFRIL
jgi:hypothetical protein